MEELKKRVNAMRIENHIITVLVAMVTAILVWVGTEINGTGKAVAVLSSQVEVLNKNLGNTVTKSDIMSSMLIKNTQQIEDLSRRVDEIESRRR